MKKKFLNIVGIVLVSIIGAYRLKHCDLVSKLQGAVL